MENIVADKSASMARSEASGLLMSVIRTLHETDTGQEREEEKRKLEAEFKQCDTTLDKMVASHQGELSSVMATYSTVSFFFEYEKQPGNNFFLGVRQIAQGSYKADWSKGELGGLQGASPLQER